MSPFRHIYTQRLQALRTEFDASFSRPAQQAEEPGEVLLRVRVGGGLLAVRLTQLAGLHLLPRVVALPGSPAGLLGLVGLRGQLIAVHDLALHLGLPAGEQPRWLLLAARERRVGLAVTRFEGQLRAPRAQLQPHGGAEAASSSPHLSASLLGQGSAPLPVLDVDSLVKYLLARASAPRDGR